MKYSEQRFSNLAFDAYHEAMGRLYSYEECKELGETYDRVRDLCSKYKENEVCYLIYELGNVFEHPNLETYLRLLKENLPVHL